VQCAVGTAEVGGGEETRKGDGKDKKLGTPRIFWKIYRNEAKNLRAEKDRRQETLTILHNTRRALVSHQKVAFL
jgi:hypothetical protein